jgi:hypothetical protein
MISTRPRRTLSDIKTHSGRVKGDHQTHRDYFQVGALELERCRRAKEREAAAARIAAINSRIAEIDQEKHWLLAGAAAVYASPEQPAASKKALGLRIKY